MSNTWIKICGITRPGDALTACRLGADAIGLVFYPPSPRSVDARQIKTIASDLPAEVTVVALFVDPAEDEVKRVLDTGLIDLLQFHGDESPEYCYSFGLPTMKAFRVGKELNLKKSIDRHSGSELVLLDAYSKQAPGGTGEIFDWDLAVDVVENDKIKLVLAGGLTPVNVAEAIRKVRPFGVDVSSGVESSPGKKDATLVEKFIEGVKSVSS